MEPVVYTRDGDIQTFKIGIPGLEKLVVDQAGVPAEQRSGLAKQLLASSALACFGAMLAAVLDARKAHYTALTGKASVELGPNDKGQGRVKHIHIAFSVELPEAEKNLFERCVRVMQGGCLVTGSLDEGITMTHELSATYTA